MEDVCLKCVILICFLVIASVGHNVALYHPNFVIGQGPSMLPNDSPLRSDVEMKHPDGFCYRIKPSMKLRRYYCVQGYERPVLCQY